MKYSILLSGSSIDGLYILEEVTTGLWGFNEEVSIVLSSPETNESGKWLLGLIHHSCSVNFTNSSPVFSSENWILEEENSMCPNIHMTISEEIS